MIVNTLESTQQRLKEIYGPLHYYTKSYCAEEASYWGELIGWVEEAVLPLSRRNSVLDIGAGYGTLACTMRQLSEAQVVTLDRNPYITAQIAREFGLTLKFGDIERHPTDPAVGGGFSVVTMTEVLEHFNFHPLPTLAYIRSLMAEGGKLLLTTPDAGSTWGKIGRPLSSFVEYDKTRHSLMTPPWLDGHFHHYTEGELRELLEDAGYRVAKIGFSQSPGGRHLLMECVA
jgi:SAM-dependent methyltransferase